MTTANEILTDLECLGVSLRADGDNLHFAPSALVSFSMRQQLRERKPELLAALSESSAPIPAFNDPPDPNASCRCGATTWIDATIHKGQSTRRDCARCGRFIAFVKWYGKECNQTENQG